MSRESLWAKVRDDGSFLSVTAHLTDTKACAASLYDLLAPASKAVWERSVGRANHARDLAIFLAAAHDVGKINPGFQGKHAGQKERLRKLGVATSEEKPDRRHGFYSRNYLFAWLEKKAPELTARYLAIAIGGHHGVFPSDTRYMDEIPSDPWAAWATEELDDLAQSLDIDWTTLDWSDPGLVWITGFVTIADWLASNEDMTGRGEVPADAKANELLRKCGFRPPLSAPPVSPCAILHNRPPRPLQKAAMAIADKDWRFAILEAPTGEGKTEAALLLCEGARASSAGLYVALPTRATANGLFDRILGYVRIVAREEEVTLNLSHGTAWMKEEFSALLETKGEDESVFATAWMLMSKRRLLATYGTGTIDQVLVGALSVRHHCLRLFALAGKTVVVDEVHAYDAYMGTILDRLLQWLRAMDCRVILLSATLPPRRRAKLFEAWGATAPAASYPNLSWVDARGEAAAIEFEANDRPAVTYVWKGDADAAISELKNAVCASKGCGAIIRNTVAEAQKTYFQLKQDGHEEVMLFHARFTVQDRAAREKEVLTRFGKDSTPEDREGWILVATQVAEQSLDLDFDYMVSALAPMDLLIQRAGRLHRHPRPTRPVASAELWVTEPEGMEREIYATGVMHITQNLLFNPLTLDTSEKISGAVSMAYEPVTEAEFGAEFDRLAILQNQDARKNALKRNFAKEYVIQDPWTQDSEEMQHCFLNKSSRVLDHDPNGKCPGTRLAELATVDIVLWIDGHLADIDHHSEKIVGSEKRSINMELSRISALQLHFHDLPLVRGSRYLRRLDIRDGSALVNGRTWKYNSEMGLHEDSSIS